MQRYSFYHSGSFLVSIVSDETRNYYDLTARRPKSTPAIIFRTFFNVVAQVDFVKEFLENFNTRTRVFASEQPSDDGNVIFVRFPRKLESEC